MGVAPVIIRFFTFLFSIIKHPAMGVLPLMESPIFEHADCCWFMIHRDFWLAVASHRGKLIRCIQNGRRSKCVAVAPPTAVKSVRTSSSAGLRRSPGQPWLRVTVPK